jgi:hypothetical protein
MISLTLFGLAVLWISMLLRYPGKRRRSSNTPHYHYYVCGSDELPTWKRKVPASPHKATRPR